METVRLEKVTFGYGEVPVLEEADFAVRKGDYILLTGENGSGKSTLLRLILGELRPQKGSVRLFQKDPEKALRENKIGYVPQNSISRNADFPATVEEIMVTGLYKRGLGFSLRREKKKCLDRLEQLGMQEVFHQRIGKLSGGQQQRVMLARAMVGDPDFLILDEPTAGVDAASVLRLYGLLEQWNKEGLTILMVSHDDPSCCKGATDILKMKQGRITKL